MRPLKLLSRHLAGLRRSPLINKRWLWIGVLASVLFTALSYGSRGHWASHINLQVQTASAVFGKLKVATPRGVLDRLVFLGSIAPLADGPHLIQIKNAGMGSSESAGTVVALTQVKHNGVDIPLELLTVTPGERRIEAAPQRYTPALYVPAGALANFRTSLKNLEIAFAGSYDSGMAEVWIDGRRYTTIDLYSRHGGYEFLFPLGEPQAMAHTVTMRLPVSEIESAWIELPPGTNVGILGAQLMVHGTLYPLHVTVDATGQRISFADDVFLNNERDSAHLQLARFIAALVFAIVLVELYVFAVTRKLWEKRYRPFWRLFLIGLAVISLGSIAAWPAIMQSDSLNTWAQTKHLGFNDWHSHVYSLFALCLSLFYESPGALTIFQTVLLAFTIAIFYFYLLTKGVQKIPVYVFFGLTVTALPVVIYPSFYVRDVLYCIGTVLLFVVLLILVVERHAGKPIALQRRHLLYLGAAIAFFASIRAEGVYLLAFVPLFYYLCLGRHLRETLLFAATGVLLFAFLTGPLRSHLNVHTEPDYGLTLVMEPLGEIISQPHRTADLERERAVVDKIINYDDLARHYRYLEAFWSDKWLKRGRYAAEDVRALQRLAVELYMLNPEIYLKNRVRNFYDALFALGGNLEVMPDFLFMRTGWDFFEEDKYLLALQDTSFHAPWLIRYQAAMQSAFHATLDRERSFFLSPRTYLWNAAFGFLLTLLVVTQWRLFPFSALVSLLILGRMAMLFMFQPAAQFKYFFDIYLWGYFLIPMALLDLTLAAKTAKAKRDISSRRKVRPVRRSFKPAMGR